LRWKNPFDATVLTSKISRQSRLPSKCGSTSEFVSIPDFQSLMLPLLIHLSDGKEHSIQETLKSLAEHFQLREEKLAQLLPSGHCCVQAALSRMGSRRIWLIERLNF
jgi:restriction system protein